MGRFDISQEVADEYRTKFRDSVQEHVDEEVLAVGTFRATGSGPKYAISRSQAGALVYGAATLIGRKRAGGLPSQFLLAVTPTKLHAFKYKQRAKGVAVREEVGAWDRAGLEVHTERLSTTTRVRLEWTPDGDKIVCDQEGLGDNPWADEVVSVLRG
ncbi:MAG TPA: hypothetical protein VF549_19375 [Solirubrobacteraceae bacterium]|jgi:hypothetical protein